MILFGALLTLAWFTGCSTPVGTPVRIGFQDARDLNELAQIQEGSSYGQGKIAITAINGEDVLKRTGRRLPSYGLILAEQIKNQDLSGHDEVFSYQVPPGHVTVTVYYANKLLDMSFDAEAGYSYVLQYGKWQGERIGDYKGTGMFYRYRIQRRTLTLKRGRHNSAASRWKSFVFNDGEDEPTIKNH